MTISGLPPVRVTLHDYQSDPALTQKDGVNLAHENIAALLREASGEALQVRFHDFNHLLADEAHARAVLSEVDVVVSNVGPHAHYYFLLRERLGLNFRIFRDVRTAIWSSYLLQEHLCQPLLRRYDVLLTGSHYARGVFEKMFAHLRAASVVVCYPLTVCFPPVQPSSRTGHGSRPVTLGYVGRLSEDKNFPDIVELLIRLNQAQPGGYRLLACGDVHSASCEPGAVRARLDHTLGPGDHLEYLPPVDSANVWPLYQHMDIKVFPSTSNLETLGRVLVEASHAGVPVVCGAHAAAPELVPKGSLSRVRYTRGHDFSAHFDHRLGEVDIDDMVRAVTRQQLCAPTCHLTYQQHPEKFRQLLAHPADGAPLTEELQLHQSQSAFIADLETSLPAPLARVGAIKNISALVPLFLGLQAKDRPERQAICDSLMSRSLHPERSARFIAKTASTRCDFTDVGGIDIELCHFANYYPSFRLRESAEKEAP